MRSKISLNIILNIKIQKVIRLICEYFYLRIKQTSIFKKLETANYYGYGINYKAELKQDATGQKIKDYLEQRDHFKFYSYTKSSNSPISTTGKHKKIMAIDMIK